MYMLQPDSQLPARFKTGRMLCRHVRTCTSTYVYVRTGARARSTGLSMCTTRRLTTSAAVLCIHTRILATSAVFLTYLLESITRLPPVLCRYPVSAHEHCNH